MRLPHICTIQKATAGSADAYGETAPASWSTETSGVACRFYEDELPPDAVAATGHRYRLACCLHAIPLAE